MNVHFRSDFIKSDLISSFTFTFYLHLHKSLIILFHNIGDFFGNEMNFYKGFFFHFVVVFFYKQLDVEALFFLFSFFFVFFLVVY